MRITLGLVLLLAACDGGTPISDAGVPDAGPEEDAEALIAEGEALLWRALAGETSIRRQAIRTLERGLALSPDHPRGSLMYGMALLSAIAEDFDVTYLDRAEAAMLHAIEVNPDDPRIPGWLGTLRVASANVLGTEQELTEAADYMIAAADEWPDFNNFSLAVAFIPLSHDTPYPQMALDRLLAIEDCGMRTDVCTNDNIPHNEEGSMMTFGDAYARLGHVEEARTYYGLALASPTASTWAYREQAQEILDGVEDRAARWTNDDPSDDPTPFSAGPTSCVGCHAP